MLNRDAAAIARNNLQEAVQQHRVHLETATKLSTELYELRRRSSEDLVADVEAFVNSLANTPKEFCRTFSEYHVERRTFEGVINKVDSELHDVTVKGGVGTGAGVAAGAATALMGPTAAMAVATTFGTASTGTAIASLSGAAATNAALAWLGGGALAAGGGGMAGGGALLALAGPVGWGLAGLAAAGGVAYMARANSKIAEEANQKRLPVEAEIRSLKLVIHSITALRDRTQMHVDGMREILQTLRASADKNYAKMTADDKARLAALLNHVQSLGKLLNQTVKA